MSGHGAPVDAFIAKDAAEAEIVRGVLEGAGIPATVFAEAVATSVFPLPVPATLDPRVAVRVPADRADEAKRVLADAREAGKLLPAD
ncbi:MAG TPA: DUF2007 domain-containing protein [Planctomycetota bacterium]|nr:DUF2007 domain-containing protein [Planctomycetota bacterium]